MIEDVPRIYPGERQGGPCGGWSTFCSQPAVERVYIEGCTFCGGADCGDSGDSLWMCDGCAAEARADSVAPKAEAK
jgi:hypothetical protein